MSAISQPRTVSPETFVRFRALFPHIMPEPFETSHSSGWAYDVGGKTVAHIVYFKSGGPLHQVACDYLP